MWRESWTTCQRERSRKISSCSFFAFFSRREISGVTSTPPTPDMPLSSSIRFSSSTRGRSKSSAYWVWVAMLCRLLAPPDRPFNAGQSANDTSRMRSEPSPVRTGTAPRQRSGGSTRAARTVGAIVVGPHRWHLRSAPGGCRQVATIALPAKRTLGGSPSKRRPHGARAGRTRRLEVCPTRQHEGANAPPSAPRGASGSNRRLEVCPTLTVSTRGRTTPPPSLEDARSRVRPSGRRQDSGGANLRGGGAERIPRGPERLELTQPGRVTTQRRRHGDRQAHLLLQ